MLFCVTHEWITGVSPHTGKPKTQTCRLKRPNEWLHEGAVYRAYPNGQVKLIYQVGKSYAVQPGRGQMGIAYITLIAIEEAPDVRAITIEQAHAEGFKNPLHFLQTWTNLHDRKMQFARSFDNVAWVYWGGRKAGWLRAYTDRRMMSLLNERPYEHYGAWRLTFGSQLSFNQLGGQTNE